MTSAEASTRRAGLAARRAALRHAAFPPGTWRWTFNMLGAMAISMSATLAMTVVAVLWGAALISLVEGPTGGWGLPITYVVAVVALPLPFVFLIREFASFHRSRFAEALDIHIASPPKSARPFLRLVRPIVVASTWRHFAYHLIAVPVSVVGGLVIVACWALFPILLWYTALFFHPALPLLIPSAAVLLAAPRIARLLGRLDLAAGRALLGPSKSEALTLQVTELARSRADIVAATDAERRRIERDLHDGAQQRLVSMAMHLGMARANPEITGPGREAIEAAHDEAIAALTELRQFVRGLHPAVLNDRGLDAALSGLAARASLPVKLRVDVPVRCAPSIEAVAYFVVSETLTNVSKHAEARTAEVGVTQQAGRLRIVVRDDGRGGASPETGSGLRGLAQRAAAVDGTLLVDSPPGGPTIITVELPCES